MEDFGYQKDNNSNDNSNFNRRIFLGLATILSISLFIYITITAYHFVYQDDENVELIKGPEFPIRVSSDEENHSTTKIDRTIYEDIFGNKKNSKEENVVIVNTPESPLPPKKDIKNNQVNIAENKIEIDVNSNKNSVISQNINNQESVNLEIAKTPIQKTEINEDQKVIDQSKTKNPAMIDDQPSIKKKYIRVQIAAMSSQEQAEQQWKKLLRIHPNLFVNLRSAIQKVDLGKRGIFYRLQVGEFFNQIEAENFCQKYISQTQKTRADCIVVE